MLIQRADHCTRPLALADRLFASSAGVGIGILVPVAAPIAAGAFEVEWQRDVLDRYCEHQGELLAQIVGGLGGGPRGQRARP